MTSAADPAPPFTGFGPDLIPFYEGLITDNSRTYWLEHKATFDEQIAGPARALAAALTEEFGAVKVFRPHRDVRFSKDKSPYKTQVSMVRQTEGVGVLYFAVAPDAVDLAGGIYAPEPGQLRRFRELQDDPRAVRSMDALLGGLEDQGFTLMTESALVTAPRGWTVDHPRIEMLRLKHIAVGQDREPGSWLHHAGCRNEVAGAWRAIQRWNDWLQGRLAP